MSVKGVKIFSKILSNMQEARIELISMASKDMASKGAVSIGAHQDLRLCKLLDEMKDTIKSEFCEITSK